MKFKAVSLAALMAASVVPATAAPAVIPAAPASGGLVVQVGGCHGDVRDHYVPEVGQRVPHYHQRGTCEPVIVSAPRQNQRRQIVDCHRDVRTHRIDGVMLRHRHVGDDCRVREVRQVNEPAPF